ncbi:MAG: molybdenum cofactor cytidylyltransferase [Rhodobacteraceae bacterium HLUCCA08]|nr:MAG: molybdenum cofactor cytidylyltransferase [Rhodobacteraceae bacterium HLUCCA08]
MVAILIPAAGASSRMRGRDKLLEPVNGRPLLAEMAARALPHGRVIVTLPGPDHARAAVLPGGVEVVPVPDHATGLSASLRRAAAVTGDDLMVLLPDMPGIDSRDIGTLIAVRQSEPGARIWQAATADGMPGHPLIFHASLVPQFADLTGDSGAAEVVKRHRDRRVLVPLAGDRARADLDTPEAWAAWRARQH